MEPVKVTQNKQITPSSFQLGSNSSSPLGWNTLPDSMWAPIWGPFSIKQTDMSIYFSIASYLILIAADSPKQILLSLMLLPAGPPPIMRTS